MENNFNKPERGGKPGLYEIEDVNGQKVELVAESHPQADAYIRMNAKFVMGIEEWREKELAKREAEVKAKLAEKQAVEASSSKKEGK